MDEQMTRDRLFLLKSGFMDGAGGPFYCPACATVEGVLAFHPRLRDLIDVQYLDFPRPRPAIVDLLGETQQGLPALVVGDDAAADAALAGLDVRESRGHRFLRGAADIGNYLARRYGVSAPH